MAASAPAARRGRWDVRPGRDSPPGAVASGWSWRTAESAASRSVSASCCSAIQARILTPNRSDVGGRSFRQRIDTAWILFFARERARTNWARAPGAGASRDAPTGRPHPIQLARPQQLGQRPRVEAIGLRPRLADGGVARETRCSSRLTVSERGAGAGPATHSSRVSLARRSWAFLVLVRVPAASRARWSGPLGVEPSNFGLIPPSMRLDLPLVPSRQRPASADHKRAHDQPLRQPTPYQ